MKFDYLLTIIILIILDLSFLEGFRGKYFKNNNNKFSRINKLFSKTTTIDFKYLKKPEVLSPAGGWVIIIIIIVVEVVIFI